MYLSRRVLGLPLRPSALGRAVSQLAGLLGPAAALPPGSGLRPLLSIPQPRRYAPLRPFGPVGGRGVYFFSRISR